MRVLILGTGDAFTRTCFGSCALIEAPAGYVLLDCPDPIHRVLAEATERAGWQVDADVIHDVLLTHLHGDHCNGLESFGFARRILRDREDAPSPRVFLNRPAAPGLWTRLVPAMEVQGWFDRPAVLADYFELREFEPGSEIEVAGLRVATRTTQHTVPTTGFRITDGSFSIGWSGDTSFERAHLDWLLEADLVVHEAGSGPIHAEIERLDALPVRDREKLRLIHLADDFDPGASAIPRLCAGDVLAP